MEEWVERLADSRTRAEAWRHLQGAGTAGTLAARHALAHADPRVRAAATGYLDHCSLDDETTRLLVCALDDPVKEVRAGAAHALVCAVCKPDEVPAGDDLLLRLLDVALSDPCATVRQTAAQTLGQHRADPRVAAALEKAHLTDPHTMVRLKAGWALRRHVVFVHQLHPPEEVRLFSIDYSAVPRHRTRRAFVADQRYGEDFGLRHIALMNHWFTVNVTLDLDGNPIEHGVDGFAYNCDISRPLRRGGCRFYEVDLELDVLVRADGRAYEITDVDKFEHACELGWITQAERAGALQGLGELVELIDQGRLHEFLEWVSPFGDIREAPFAKPYELLDAKLYPQLKPGIRG